MPDGEQSVPPSTRLYRRLHPTQVVWDDNQGRARVSSGAFTDEFMSVNLGNKLDEIGEPPDFALRNYPMHSLASLTASFVSDLGQEIRSTPTEDDPTHGEVVGRKRGARSKQFAKAAVIEILRREFLQPDVREALSGGDS